MQSTLMTFAVALALTGQPGLDEPANRGSDLTLPRCLVQLLRQADVAAQQPGLLELIEAQEGHEVESGKLLAQIDDSRAVMALGVAETELVVANVRATNRINIKYAKAQYDVAVATWRKNMAANKDVRGAIPEVVLEELKLQAIRAKLGIEQAGLEFEESKATATVKQVQVDAAEKEIDRHKILAPLAGEVVKVYKNKGEWVQAGEPVMRIVQTDRLKIEGFINVAAYNSADVRNRPVTIRLPGLSHSFKGKITFVDPRVQAGGDFRISAEVANEKDPISGEWMLRPGVEATMTVHLNPLTASRRSDQPR